MGRAFEARRAGKEKRWGEMSRLYPKLGKIITMAAKAGGSDPESNTALKTAVNNAKAQNMPKDNIEKAIKRATAADATNYDEVSYEGKGPHGALLWVECATDNSTRTVANVKTLFNKNGGQVVNNGSLDFMFDRKSVVEFAKADGLDLEDIELIEGVKATLQRISNNPQEFTDAQIEEIEVLIDKLEEDDDVQAVYTNIA